MIQITYPKTIVTPAAARACAYPDVPVAITNGYNITESNCLFMTSTSRKPAASKKKAAVPAIEKEVQIKAPVEDVWAALTDPEAIGAWMDDDSVKFGKKVGGKYALFGGVTTGKITAIDKPTVLEYTWRQAEWEKSDPDTLVRWELKPEGKKTRVHLVHSQFADRQNRDDHDEGWDVYFLEPMIEWLESKK